MGKLLSVFRRRLCGSMAVAALIMGVDLWGRGEFHLMKAVILGFILAAVFFFLTALRLKRSMMLGRDGAKRQMLWGLALRLGLLFAVLFVAVKISAQVFTALAVAFLVGYALCQINLIILNYTDKSQGF